MKVDEVTKKLGFGSITMDIGLQDWGGYTAVFKDGNLWVRMSSRSYLIRNFSTFCAWLILERSLEKVVDRQIPCNRRFISAVLHIFGQLFKYQGALFSRTLNMPKYKTSNTGRKSNQSSPTKRALLNALNFTDWRLFVPWGPTPWPLWARRHCMYYTHILWWLISHYDHVPTKFFHFSEKRVPHENFTTHSPSAHSRNILNLQKYWQLFNNGTSRMTAWCHMVESTNNELFSR